MGDDSQELPFQREGWQVRDQSATWSTQGLESFVIRPNTFVENVIFSFSLLYYRCLAVPTTNHKRELTGISACVTPQSRYCALAGDHMAISSGCKVKVISQTSASPVIFHQAEARYWYWVS
eukprot:1317738-Amorphochlora_amoeboformis.AAC.2